MSTDPTTTVVEFPARIREIRSYRGLDLADEAWKARLASGTATRDDLVVWILTIDDAGYETIPGSMGMQWIWNHPHEFAELVGDVDEFILELLEQVDAAIADSHEGTARETDISHLRWWFFKSFPCKRELMTLLSPTMRELWVSEIYTRFGANNNGWIDSVVRLGVPRQVIAAAILKRLGDIEDPRDFLEYGHSNRSSQPWSALWSLGITREEMDRLRPQIQQDPSVGLTEIERRLAAGTIPREGDFHSFHDFHLWDVLTNEELYQALLVCAEKSPNRTMAIMDDAEVKCRLTLEQVDRLVTSIMRKLTSLHGLTLEMLERHLTLSGREILARQLVPVKADYLGKMTAQFLFKVLCELPKNKREAFFWDVIVPVVGEVNPIRLYTAWRQLELNERDLEDTLRDKLDREGYAIGTIREGTIPSGKRQGQRQWYVEIRGVRYVCDSDLHRRFYPKAGMEVAFSFERAHWLVPNRVAVVVMTPIMEDIKY